MELRAFDFLLELLGASFAVRISTPLDAESLCARHASFARHYCILPSVLL